MPFNLLSYIVKGFISKGLRNLPLDVELVRLNAGHILHLAAFTGMCGVIIHILLYDKTRKVDRCQIAGKSYMKCTNNNDVFNIKDLEYGIKFCRCLKSKQFPYCDGSHNGFNDGTYTDIYPLVISRRLDYPYFQHETINNDDMFEENVIYKESQMFLSQPPSSSVLNRTNQIQYYDGNDGRYQHGRYQHGRYQHGGHQHSGYQHSGYQHGGYGEMKYTKAVSTTVTEYGDMEENGNKKGDYEDDEYKSGDVSPLELYDSEEVESEPEKKKQMMMVYSNSEVHQTTSEIYSSNDDGEVFNGMWIDKDEPETEEYENDEIEQQVVVYPNNYLQPETQQYQPETQQYQPETQQYQDETFHAVQIQGESGKVEGAGYFNNGGEVTDYHDEETEEFEDERAGYYTHEVVQPGYYNSEDVNTDYYNGETINTDYYNNEAVQPGYFNGEGANTGYFNGEGANTGYFNGEVVQPGHYNSDGIQPDYYNHEGEVEVYNGNIEGDREEFSEADDEYEDIDDEDDENEEIIKVKMFVRDQQSYSELDTEDIEAEDGDF